MRSTADLVEEYLKSTLKSNKESRVFIPAGRSLLWSDVRALCCLSVPLLCTSRAVFEWEEPRSKNACKYPGPWLQFERFNPHIRSHSFHFTLALALALALLLARPLPPSPSLMLIPSFSFSRCPQMAFALLYRAELRRASLYRHNCQTNTLRALLCVRWRANNRITG